MNIPKFKEYFDFNKALELSYIYNINSRKIIDGIRSRDIEIISPPVLRKVKIGKKIRDLYVDSRGSIFYQQIILHYIEKFYYPKLIHNSVYSYQKGKSAKQAIDCIRSNLEGFNYPIYKADITDYFNSIKKSHITPILDKLKDLGCDPYIVDYIDRYTSNENYYYKGKLLKGRPNSPQGSPLSSFISNAVLYDFDREMSKKGDFYIRYADDILTDIDIKELKGKIQNMGFEINDKKIQIFGKNDNINYLGVLIKPDGSLELTREKIREYYLNTRHIIRVTMRSKDNSKPINLQKTIYKINRYWFLDFIKYSRFDSIVNKGVSKESYSELDKLIRNAIRIEYFGKNNNSIYRELSDKKLYEMNLIPLVEAYKLKGKGLLFFDSYVSGKIIKSKSIGILNKLEW